GKVMMWIFGTAWDRHGNPIMSDYLYTCYPDGRPGAVAPRQPPNQPACFMLNPAYPNPFNSTTTIGYILPSPAQVKIDIYDINGDLLVELFNHRQDAGKHNVVWEGKDRLNRPVPSGLYFYNVKVFGENGSYFQRERKMVLMK
ncbi:MAG: FlgD immunoglobulin-like domain containing protein, partial [Calditrichota bacterium]